MVEAGGRAQENTQYEFYKMDELFRHLPTKFILLPNYSVLMYGSSPEKLIIADVPILKLFANLKHFSTVPEKIAALQKSMKSLASTSITTVAKRIDSSVRPTVPKIIESAKPNTFIKPASILKSSTVFASTSNLAKVMINETDYTVNTDYLYEDNDVNAILNERIVELGGSIHGTPVEVMAAANTMSPNQLKDILNAHEPGKRLVMIPCNIGNFHWVGLLFEFDEDSQLIRAEYIDSANIPVPATLNIQLQSLYPGNTFVPRNDLIRQHGDGTSCGPCTIENLILAAQNASPEESVSMSSIRAQHLALWQVKRPGDYVAFERRQRENRPTFNASVSLGFKSKPKSESEVTGIKQVAELINNVKDEAIKEALISAIRGEGLDEAKHGEHLIAIRRVCFDHRKNPEIQAIAEHLFGIADLSAYEKFDDYFKDSNLSFEYECLQDISQLLAKPSMVTPTLS